MDHQTTQSIPPVSPTGLEQAQKLFSEAGLAFPVLPADLAIRLAPLQEWVFGTRAPSTWLYEINQYIDEAVAGEIEDYILLGHAGHGTNSWAIHCYILYRGLALLLQVGFGGAYMEPEETRAHLAEVLEQAGHLITAAQSHPAQDSRRMVVAVSDFYGSRWGWVEPEMDWHRGSDTLGSALNALRGQPTL